MLTTIACIARRSARLDGYESRWVRRPNGVKRWKQSRRRIPRRLATRNGPRPRLRLCKTTWTTSPYQPLTASSFFKHGAIVQLVNLKTQPHLNGQYGVLLRYDKQRLFWWEVELHPDLDATGESLRASKNAHASTSVKRIWTLPRSASVKRSWHACPVSTTLAFAEEPPLTP